MELQLQHEASNEYSGLISFRTDWLSLFAVQEASVRTGHVVGYGGREREVQRKNETGILQEQITFNEARRGSNQISELLN